MSKTIPALTEQRIEQELPREKSHKLFDDCVCTSRLIRQNLVLQGWSYNDGGGGRVCHRRGNRLLGGLKFNCCSGNHAARRLPNADQCSLANTLSDSH